jgi:hypothetical protein
MKLFVSRLGSFILLSVAAFCLFGFMATFEQSSNALGFRIGYSIIGIVCLMGLGFLISNAVRK